MSDLNNGLSFHSFSYHTYELKWKEIVDRQLEMRSLPLSEITGRGSYAVIVVNCLCAAQ